MQEIRLKLAERSYSISIDCGILKDLGKAITRFEFSRKIAVISNPVVYNFYGTVIAQSLKDDGFRLSEIIIPDGEEYKSLEWAGKVYGELLKARLDRQSAVIALGGGVIGDLAGFAASTYMRGVAIIQVPTTLLAQVDSSVGGKTGVNHPLGKNMIGTFWQPRLVWIDPDTLETLPRRELIAGLAEVIKYGIIRDRELFDFLQTDREKILRLDRQALTHLIKRSCEIKADVVSRDERESGLRAILNYGHTIGHAIETVTGYKKYLHGEAIAMGMYAEAVLSNRLGIIDDQQVESIKALIDSYDLPVLIPADINLRNILSAIQIDKKAVAGELACVVPDTIGSVLRSTDFTAADVQQALEHIQAAAK
jgi:3-dehydroquinate synthase